MVDGCLFVSNFGGSDFVCCEQKGRIVRVVSRLGLSGCVCHFVGGSLLAHAAALESEVWWGPETISRLIHHRSA
jgi:hypothetical protein